MSQSLTTWRVWRLRRRSTRSNGFLSRMQHISCFPPTVCIPGQRKSSTKSKMAERTDNQSLESVCMWANVVGQQTYQILCKVIHSSRCRMLKYTAGVKGGVVNITWLCVFVRTNVFAWLNKSHHQKSFRLRASCMLSQQDHILKACATTRHTCTIAMADAHTSAERRLADCGLHAWLLQKCSRWLEQMVESPVAMASLLWHQYSQWKLKAGREKKATTWLRLPSTSVDREDEM